MENYFKKLKLIEKESCNEVTLKITKEEAVKKIDHKVFYMC